MESRSIARALVVGLVGVAYATIAFFVAGTGVGEVLPPLSRAATLAVPLATGLIASCAAAAPPAVLMVIVPWLSIAVAGAVAVTAGWLPLPWFFFSGVALAAASLLGGIAGGLLRNGRARIAVAVVGAFVPVIVASYTTSVLVSEPPVVTAQATIQAPVAEVWQEVIGSDGEVPKPSPATPARGPGIPRIGALAVDEPRPFTVRRTLFTDGSLAAERVSEWDDDEHLKVGAAVPTMQPPRGLAAWRAGWGESWVVADGASYDLAAIGDSASTLTMSGTYRLAVHANAYPPSWLADVAGRMATAELATYVSRSVARVTMREPPLTAEMRMLRTGAIADLGVRYRRTGDRASTASEFVNGEYKIEGTQGVVAAVAAEPPMTEAALRGVLLKDSNRARTTMWMWIGAPAGAANTASATDTLHFEFEDYDGRCVAEVDAAAFGDKGVHVTGVPRRSRCEMSAMRERARRSRLLAQLPISAGKLEDSWSVALAATGTVRVYRDSVVVRADTLRLKAKPLDGAAQAVDSIALGLSLGGGNSWSISRRSPAFKLERSFAAQEEWTRTRMRFTVPIDEQFPLERSWPTFEVVLSPPKTKDNPYGVAWTYAHAPEAFFNGVRRMLP